MYKAIHQICYLAVLFSEHWKLVYGNATVQVIMFLYFDMLTQIWLGEDQYIYLIGSFTRVKSWRYKNILILISNFSSHLLSTRTILSERLRPVFYLNDNQNNIRLSGIIDKKFRCVKSVPIRSYYGLHFLAFGLDTERYGVSLRIQSKCGKMGTIVTPNTDTFKQCSSQEQYALTKFSPTNNFLSKRRTFHFLFDSIYSVKYPW